MKVSGRPDEPPILSIRAERISWPVAIAELVDNSFDAGARRIEVKLEPHALIVKDDGRGVADLNRLLKYGEHHRHDTTRLGRFGVGAKSVIFRGNFVRIDTVHAGRRYGMRIDVPAVTDWDALDAEDPLPTEDAPGTIIEVSKIPRDVGTKILEAPIREALSETFAPAIVSGRQILLGSGGAEPTPVGAWTPPLLKNVTEGKHEFDDGRSFTYRAGLLVDPKDMARAKVRGTWIAYAHRYLDHSRLGFDISPAARVHAQVQLHEQRRDLWKLETHKRELQDRQREELAEVLGNLLLPLFMAEEAEEQDLFVSGVNAILASAFGEAGGTSTPRPGSGHKPGGEWGNGEEKVAPPPPRKPRPNKPPTTEKTRRPLGHGLTIKRERQGEDELPFQYVQERQRATIVFNVDHALWKQLSAAPSPHSEIAVAREALFIYTHSRVQTKGQAVLFGLRPDDLSNRAQEFGRLLRAAVKP